LGFSLCTCIVVTEKKKEKRAEPWQLCSTVHVGGHCDSFRHRRRCCCCRCYCCVVVTPAPAAAVAASAAVIAASAARCFCCCRRCFCFCCCCCCRCCCRCRHCYYCCRCCHYHCCCRCRCCCHCCCCSMLPLSLLLPLSSPSPSGEMAHLVERLPTPMLGSYRCCCGGRQARRHLIRWRWAQRWSVGWDGMRDWGK